MAKKFVMGNYNNYAGQETINNLPPLEIVILGQTNINMSLPNTILLSVAKNTGKSFCNVLLKKALDKSGVVVSIGSACNTFSPNASHVLNAIKAPSVIKKGVLRISLCDTTTKKNILCFLGIFTNAVLSQVAAETH